MIIKLFVILNYMESILEVDFLKGMTILVVEDSQADREIIVKVLGKYFGNVYQAENGQEAYEIFTSFKDIDLIVTDMTMPEMNGLELLEKVRQLDMNIPFIFITARSDSQSIIEAVNLNASSYILKPIDFTDLLQKIDFICEKKYYEKRLDSKQKEIEYYLEAVDKVSCIYKMKEDGDITYMNKTLMEVSGYDATEIPALRFEDIIHPDVHKKYIDDTWDEIKNDKAWRGTTKFISKDEDTFYLNNTIFKVNDDQEEFITIAFLTTKENLEKRDFHRKVLLNIKEANKKEFELKKQIKELKSQLQTSVNSKAGEKQLIDELEDKVLASSRQIKYYEQQIEGISKKFTILLNNKKEEVESYIALMKERKKKIDSVSNEKKELQDDIELLRKQNKKLLADNEKKAKRIKDLMNIVLEYEEKAEA